MHIRERKNPWEVIAQIAQRCDIILEVIDARMPELSRNVQVEEIVKNAGKPLIIVLNKTDLIMRNGLRMACEQLRKDYPCYPVSGKNKRGMRALREYLYILKYRLEKSGMLVREDDLKKFERHHSERLKVGLVGYPNTGKSSVINALVFKNKAKVTSKAGTTHGVQWIAAGKEIMLVDSHGVIPLENNDEVRYAMFAAKDSNQLKNLQLVAFRISELFKYRKEKLKSLYNITINNENPEEVIEMIGKRKSFLMKKGKVDENRTAALIIQDWQEGRLNLR